jgi:hypothetical protein
VRTSILLWSTFSGVVLGLFVDAALAGVVLLLGAAAPGISARLTQRWVTALALVVLVAIPLVGAILGYLEGRLKLS